MTGHGRFRLVGGLLVALLMALVACSGGSDGGDDDAAPAADAAPTSTQTPAESLITDDLTGGGGAVTAVDRLLVWVGRGSEPGQQSADAPGQLLMVRGTGATDVVMALPRGTSRVLACGEQATSPDGRHFAFFAGGDSGSLYLMDGIDTPQEVREMNALGCGSVAAFQFSPDSERYGVIDFEPDAINSTFAHGFLYIYETGSNRQVIRFENVAAFDISDDMLAYVGFFADRQGRAVEAGISLWDGSEEPEEVTTLFAEPGCQFASGQIVFTGEQTVAVLMGERCPDSVMRWTLHTVDGAAGAAALALSGQTGGSYLSYARTNGLYAAPDAGGVVYTLPDGLSANSVSVRRADLSSAEPGADLVRYGVMPRYTSRPYDPDLNTSPAIAPDGNWVAVASSDPDANVAVNVFDLRSPDAAPIVINGSSRGDRVVSMAFTPDSSTLLFVTGGSDGGDNSLFALDLTTGVETRVTRGHFVQLVPSPDNDVVGVSAWDFPDDPREPRFMILEVIALEDGAANTLARGALLTEAGQVQDRHFIYPLAWRRG